MERPFIYLAGGMRSGWQDKVIYECGPYADIYDPRVHGFKSPELYTPIDLHWVRCCNITFAYAEKDNPGLWNMAAELAMAVAFNHTVIYADERSANDINFARYSAMLRYMVTSYWENLPGAIEYLKGLLKR